jgi:hypothetical protein
VVELADASKPNMGLTVRGRTRQRAASRGRCLCGEELLAEGEIQALERIVSMYLDYAENQATRRIAMRMQDWVGKLDAFLQFR